MRIWIGAAALSVVFWTACHGDHGHSDQMYCTLIAGAPENVVATSTRADAPELVVGDTPYEVRVDAMKSTYVKFELEAAGAVAINSGTADALADRYFQGSSERTLPEAEAIPECATVIPTHFDLTLQEAGTYTLELKPAAGPSVRLLIDEAEAH